MNNFLRDFMFNHVWGAYTQLLRWEYYPDYPIRLFQRKDASFLEDIQTEKQHAKAFIEKTTV